MKIMKASCDFDGVHRHDRLRFKLCMFWLSKTFTHGIEQRYPLRSKLSNMFLFLLGGEITCMFSQ